MNRRPRLRENEIKVTFTPVEAAPLEYAEAWAGALEILCHLSQRIAADRKKGGE